MVADLALEHDLIVVTDEVYEHSCSPAPCTSRWRHCRGWPSAR